MLVRLPNKQRQIVFCDMKEELIRKFIKNTGLSNDEVMEFLSLAEERTIPAKKLLITPGKFADKAYFILNGTIRHYFEDGAQQITKNFLRGPSFMLTSLTAFFLENKSEIYCEALTELQVIQWERRDLLNFANTHTRMYKFLLNAVVYAFNKKELKEIAFVKEDAQERYLQFLKDFPNLVNEIPIQYIASYLGIRPETLSRIRARKTS